MIKKENDSNISRVSRDSIELTKHGEGIPGEGTNMPRYNIREQYAIRHHENNIFL